MFARLKKLFEKKPPRIDLLAPVPEGAVAEMDYSTSDGKEIHVKFLFPQTFARYLEAVKKEDERRRNLRQEYEAWLIEHETQAVALLKETGNPAQMELNRREAERLRKEAKRWSGPPAAGWDAAYDVLRWTRREEALALLAQAEVLIKTHQIQNAQGDNTYRTLVRYQSRVFVIIQGLHDVVATEFLEQMNSEELLVLSSLPT